MIQLYLGQAVKYNLTHITISKQGANTRIKRDAKILFQIFIVIELLQQHLEFLPRLFEAIFTGLIRIRAESVTKS